MPITSTELVFRLSGGSANSTPAASLGGAISSTTMGTTTIFDAVASSEASAGSVEYRCVYVRNNNATLTLSNARVWLSVVSSGSKATHAIGVGTSAVNGTETSVANETTAPAGVTFSAPTVIGDALALGDLPVGQHRAIWIRRTVPSSTTPSGTDGFTINISGDSPP